MFRVPQRENKLLVAIHGWSATVLGLLLYAVVFTGTVAVLALEIGYWSVSTSDTKNPFAYKINATVQSLAKKVGRAYREDVSLSKDTAGNLSIFFHKTVRKSNGRNRSRGVLYKVNAETGEVISRQEGFGVDLARNDRDRMLRRFIVDSHVRLYMPRPWGLLVTGILGMVMMIAALTGLIMHRHLIRDAFTLRTHRSAILDARDRHTVAASWGLPYAFLLALTGCFFSFAISFGIPALAWVSFGGNIEQMGRTIAGTQLQRPGKRIQSSDIDAIIADATHRAGVLPRSVNIEYFGRKNAKVSTRHLARFGELEGKTYRYKGLDGTFEKRLPAVGQVPSIGGTIVSIIGPLHFGSFAGYLSKIIWVALGFASCYMIVTGMNLWVQRRAEESRAWRFFGRYIDICTIGLPLALVGSAYAFFLYRHSDAVVSATPLGFVVVALPLLALGLFVPRRQLATGLWMALSLSLLALPIARYLSGGFGWLEALSQGAITVVAIDLVLILSALACAWTVRKSPVVGHSLTAKTA
ncbi:MAG: PepSY-associated TM helix domain-containing protein [Pseudomonadota bacterium]